MIFTDDWSVPSIFVSRLNRILRIDPDFVGTNFAKRLLDGNDVITALAHDWLTRTIYFSVNGSKAIADEAVPIYMLNLDDPSPISRYCSVGDLGFVAWRGGVQRQFQGGAGLPNLVIYQFL